ncbi:MAG: DEAD/DEAH box helicase [Ignavibacteria bacterium]|nr:DEAD/DEAH box helicase [Ignavibacteria bacterium]
MNPIIKNQKKILEKLSIEKLNAMQEEARSVIHSSADVVLLSPTGTGKTLAYLLPIVSELDRLSIEVQALIVVPSRELAIQIEQVTREMGAGIKANAVYGGRSFGKDKTELKHRPAILIGTPGRIADHLRNQTFSTEKITRLVLDEFDKSLEIGFEAEMIEIIEALSSVKKRLLTSATFEVEIPDFVGLKEPKTINYLTDTSPQLQIKTVISPSKNKLETLVRLISHIGDAPGIIFCNFKDTIQDVSDFLTENQISHGCFFGGMEQKDRERALIKFRNGTYPIMVATDLAARGLDIPEIKFIIHFQLPNREHEFIHRNGRTARMFSDGTAYVIKSEQENLPDFVHSDATETLKDVIIPLTSNWGTVFISGGRKDKISKGDIAGLFFKQGQLDASEVGVIEIKLDCAFVSVKANKIDQLIKRVDTTKLKNKKIRVFTI